MIGSFISERIVKVGFYAIAGFTAVMTGLGIRGRFNDKQVGWQQEVRYSDYLHKVEQKSGIVLNQLEDGHCHNPTFYQEMIKNERSNAPTLGQHH